MNKEYDKNWFMGIYRQWYKHFEGIVNHVDLKEIGYHRDEKCRLYIHYECPCGGDDHYAIRAIVQDGETSAHLSDVLNCYWSEPCRQWLIRPVDIVATIFEEEEAYLKLIDKAPPIVRKVVAKMGMTEAAAHVLKDRHGIDREFAEEIMGEKFPVNVLEM